LDKRRKILVVFVHCATIICFLGAFVLLHVLFNDCDFYYEFYFFFDYAVTPRFIFDLAMILIGTGFILSIILTLYIALGD